MRELTFLSLLRLLRLLRLLSIMILGLGCASKGTPLVDLETARAQMIIARPNLAPPAARDALRDGLAWIARDAIATQVSDGKHEKTNESTPSSAWLVAQILEDEAESEVPSP